MVMTLAGMSADIVVQHRQLLGEKIDQLGVASKKIQSEWRVVRNIVAAIFAKEGMLGFYRGVAPTLVHSVTLSGSFTLSL